MFTEEQLASKERNSDPENDFITSNYILRQQEEPNVNDETLSHAPTVPVLSEITKSHFLNCSVFKEQDRKCTTRAEESKPEVGKL